MTELQVTVDRPPLPDQASPGRGPRTRRSAVPRPPPGGQGSTPCQPTRGVTGRARAPCREPTDCSIDGEGPAACPRWWCRSSALSRSSRAAVTDSAPYPSARPARSPRDDRPPALTQAPLGSRPRLASRDASAASCFPSSRASTPTARPPRRSAPLRSASRHTVAPKGACFAISLSMLSIRTRFRPLAQRPQRPLPCSA
jgi:hypothetical protein